MRKWIREGWKTKLAMALFVVCGIAYAGRKLYALGGEGLVLRGGLIEAVLMFFGIVVAALVIVLGSAYLSRMLVIRHQKKEGRGVIKGGAK